MLTLTLLIVSFFVILFSVIIGLIIVYHFKRFGIKGDQNIDKLLKIFKIGLAIIILFNLILLLLIII